jgi:hypothetical protein
MLVHDHGIQRTHPMLLLRPTLFAAVLALPLPLLAAYKCSVDGRTVYQQAPCGAGAQGRAMSLREDGPPPADPPGQGGRHGAGQNDVTPQELVTTTFGQLKGGAIPSYAAMFCPPERAAQSSSSMGDVLRALGSALARDGAELAAIDTSAPDKASFTIRPRYGEVTGDRRKRIGYALFGRGPQGLCLKAFVIGA